MPAAQLGAHLRRLERKCPTTNAHLPHPAWTQVPSGLGTLGEQYCGPGVKEQGVCPDISRPPRQSLPWKGAYLTPNRTGGGDTLCAGSLGPEAWTLVQHTDVGGCHRAALPWPWRRRRCYREAAAGGAGKGLISPDLLTLLCRAPNFAHPGGIALPRGGGGSIGHNQASGSVRPCLSIREPFWTGLPEPSRHLLLTGPRACQGLGAQGTVFL